MIHQPLTLTKERKASKTTDLEKLKSEVRYKQRLLKELAQVDRDNNWALN